MSSGSIPAMKVQKRNRRSAVPLPDDVVMEILSRMPAHDVLKCRSVCRRWRALISTQHFQELHIKAKAYHPLMILVQKIYPMKRTYELLLLDKWEQPRKKPRIHRVGANFIDNSSSTEFVLSYDGIIVMRSNKFTNPFLGFTIVNPISGDVVRVVMRYPSFSVMGMFFNPFIKEYCILFRTYGSDVKFRMLNLGAQPCCRALEQSVSFRHHPRNPSYRPPVVIDYATIYWLVDDRSGNFPSCEELIMAFDIKTEVFTFLPHPDPIDDCYCLRHWDMNIINIDGCLSFVQSKIELEISALIINIWALKDTAAGLSRLWIKTHSLCIDIDQFNIPRLESFSDFMVMALGKGELLLRYSAERVYAYSLERGTLRKIGQTYQNSNLVHMSIFVPSFVSLRNCKPEIFI